jgi:nucleoside-diphosphate-sugar epimerase
VRVFLAGASGVIGVRLVPLLVAASHEVVGMTRTPAKAGMLGALGAEPVVCDVYDADALRRAVVALAPDLVLHELTDLPDDEPGAAASTANARMRRDGTRNLLAAAHAARAERFVAQSIAWDPPGDGALAKSELERLVLEACGVVLRYGRFYGPGTYHETQPAHPRIHVDDAARRTVELLDAPAGIYEIVEARRTDRP